LRVLLAPVKDQRQLEANKERVAAWVNLQQTNRVIQTVLEERLQAVTHLSWAEFEVLWRLELAAEHPLQMSEIAEQLLGSPSGITRMADRLEKDGLIARETPRENRRVVHVKLTKRGASVLADARNAFGDALGDAFSAHLSEADVAALRRLTRKLLEGNGAWVEARCNPAFAGVGSPSREEKAPAKPARSGRR
jgi:DNA-binding MarR family transcriptional regulator